MIKIITDSASDITVSQAEKLGIHIIPLRVNFQDEEYLDGIDLNHESFFEKLIETDALPQTSQINPFEYRSVFEAETADGSELICVTISSKLSGCYQNAVMAASDFEGKVFVVDSLNAAIGQRLVVERIVQLKNQGLSAARIQSVIDEEKHDVCLIALLDTLEYLKKGGRISPAVAAACSILSIKPVIAVEEGAISLMGKARGSKNGNNKLNELVNKVGGIDFSRPYGIAYSGLSNNVLIKYRNDSTALYAGHEDELRICTIGAAIGTHVGPGAVAAAFFHR